MPEVILVTGQVNSGKTTHLEKLIATEKAKGLAVSGIIARGVFKNNQKIGYDVVDLVSGSSLPLARTGEFEGDFKLGKFAFSSKAFTFAEKALLDYVPGGVVFLDEAGPLELGGKGYADCIRILLEANIQSLYIVVREDILEEFKKMYLIGRTAKIIAVIH
jgi:molybdopterin-guanine dinucleotide biosynthesis protein A